MPSRPPDRSRAQEVRMRGYRRPGQSAPFSVKWIVLGAMVGLGLIALILAITWRPHSGNPTPTTAAPGSAPNATVATARTPATSTPVPATPTPVPAAVASAVPVTAFPARTCRAVMDTWARGEPTDNQVGLAFLPSGSAFQTVGVTQNAEGQWYLLTEPPGAWVRADKVQCQ